MSIVPRLKQDHAELRHVADQLALLLASDQLADPRALSACRWSLARLVTRHLAIEDEHVYRPLDGDVTAVAKVAHRLRRELGDLHAAFQKHITRWSGEAVARDWVGYCRDANALIKALNVRIDREEAELYPLIAEADRKAA